MNALTSALLGPPPAEAVLGPPLKTTEPYIIYGNSNNNQVWFQNRRLYLSNGRILSQEELAGDNFDYVPIKLRQAVAADMAKPVARPVFVPLKEMTPEEQLNHLDAQLVASKPRFTERQALGIITRTPLSAE